MMPYQKIIPMSALDGLKWEIFHRLIAKKNCLSYMKNIMIKTAEDEDRMLDKYGVSFEI